MKSITSLLPINDAIGAVTRHVAGWQHLVAALVAVLIMLLMEPVCSVAPRFVLAVLAWTTSFAGVMAWSFHKAYECLLVDLAPLMREVGHARASLEMKNSEAATIVADRDRWRSAVEQAAGGAVGETPTELIARQALRIRTLEREHAAGRVVDGDRT